MREETDGSVCPACLGTQVGYDVVSYLSGVRGEPEGFETLTEEQVVCYDCGERAPLCERRGIQYSPESLQTALNQLRRE